MTNTHVVGKWYALLRAVPPERVRFLLFWIFWLYIVLFPFGRAFEVAGPLCCILPLAVLYWKDWKNCTLRHLPVFWLFIVFFVAIVGQIAFSQWPSRSWESVRPNLFRAFLLPFIGMECTRSEKDLRMLALAFFCAAFLQGLDGIWQYVTGFDFVKHIPIMAGRLTSSFHTYRTGNYMGMILAPALAFALLPQLKNTLIRRGTALCLLAPALFLWIFAQARMGYCAFAFGLYLAWLSSQRKIRFYYIAVPIALFILLILFGPNRITLATALDDGRIELWSTALKTIPNHPWFGTGISTFIPALLEAGYNLPINGLSVFHPHNAYLQFLLDGGVFGFLLMLIFLLGSTWWSWRLIRRGLFQEMATMEAEGKSSRFWHMAMLFWAGWFGYLVVLCGGHDFYRSWFLSVGMTLLGILYGIGTHGPKKNF